MGSIVGAYALQQLEVMQQVRRDFGPHPAGPRTRWRRTRRCLRTLARLRLAGLPARGTSQPRWAWR